jgi:PIN domain nuclease of toxin-antitoxin system
VKLLLDTHIWLWSSLEPQRLTRRLEKALAEPANELWLSPIFPTETPLITSLQLPHKYLT